MASDRHRQAAFGSTRSAAFTSAPPDTLFQQLKAKVPKATIDGTKFYFVEGDTPLDETELEIYAAARQRVNEARRAGDLAGAAGLGIETLAPAQRVGLLGMIQAGKKVRWKPGLILSYRVIRDTFTTDDRYDKAVTGMKSACEAWEATCGVKFQHRQELDKNPGLAPDGALFVVREITQGEPTLIASAFFPNDPPSRRRVLIYPGYFAAGGGGFDPVGVLRHELGHVLGFRHEHIRGGAPAACPDEPDFDTIALTEYDPQSVMHYFCGGKGALALEITPLDRAGAQLLYGPPTSALEYFE